MTDTPSSDRPAPPPASPYGPAGGIADATAEGTADGVEQLFGETGAPDAPAPTAVAAPDPTPTGDSEAVTRARRTLKRLAVALPLTGVVLSIAAIVVFLSAGGDIFGVDPVNEIAGLLLTFVGPTLVVLGLHMIVWRAMVRPLTRMTPGSRIGMLIGIGGVLSFVSVILVFILIFVGFMLVSLLLASTVQGF